MKSAILKISSIAIILAAFTSQSYAASPADTVEGLYASHMSATKIYNNEERRTPSMNIGYATKTAGVETALNFDSRMDAGTLTRDMNGNVILMGQ